MSSIIFIDGTSCIGKSTIASALKKKLNNYAVKYYDSDVLYDQYKREVIQNLSNDNDITKCLEMSVASYQNPHFISWLKSIIVSESDKYETLIVSITLASDCARALLNDDFVQSSKSVHVILDMNEELIAQRIDESGRKEEQRIFAESQLRYVPSRLKKYYPNAFWIDMGNMKPNEIVDIIIQKLNA